MTDTCQHVTERASDGACATCGHDWSTHGFGSGAQHCWSCDAVPGALPRLHKDGCWHPFLGAVLEVCEHAEEEHKQDVEPAEGLVCHGCLLDSLERAEPGVYADHAYTPGERADHA